MLRPDYFNNKADTLISYYQELEDWLLKDIAERLLMNNKLSATADRNLFMLQQMGVQNKEIQERLQKLTNLSDSELQYLLQEAVVASWKADSAVFEEIGTNIQIPLENARVRQIMNAEYAKTRGELNNLTRTTMNQANMDLINLMNEADIRMAGGMQSYSSAICDILDHYAKAGLMVGYPAGTQRSLEAAVRCAVVTSMNQTTAQVTNGYIAEEGIEYVLVSAHYGARHDEKHPEGLQSHDWWQGKAFKIRGSEEGFPNLLESTGYDIDPITGRGTVVNPLGLHGYNCRHSHQPWDKDLDNPWINPDGTPRIDPEKSREQYERQQAQRSMERTIRADKRQLNMKQLEMDLLPEDSIELANAKADYERLAYKYSQHNREYNLYCERHGLTKQSDRLKIAGFHRAEAAKAGGAAKKFKSELVF